MIKRRDLLKNATVMGAAAVLGPKLVLGSSAHAMSCTPLSLPARIQFDAGVFTLGVASGDPTPDSVILWTRVAPCPLEPQGGLTSDQAVTWRLATDIQFTNIVASGVVTAKPEHGGAIHIDATGLSPDTEYFYYFEDTNGVFSRIGRTKTAPNGVVENLRFAFVSCQNINTGRYGAFQRIFDDNQNLDFALHLGDTVYENSLGAAMWPGQIQQPNGAMTLEDYRLLHAVYRGDPHLRAGYTAVPWIVTWDDHEVVNEYWSTGPGTNFAQRRNAAYQAWYENMPIRAPAGPPDASGFRIYRQLQFGDLLDLTVLDTRQYRDRRPGPNGNFDDPNRTMLGATQKQWLKNKLSASTANWRCIAQQILMAEINGVTPYTSAWQGYAAERAEILGHIADNGIQNVVVVSGDIHQSIVSNLKANFDNLLAPNVATEFLGTSITSPGPGGTGTTAAIRSLVYPLNPHVRYTESELHGYVVCEVSKAKWIADYRMVDLTNPSSPAPRLARFKVKSGVPEVLHTGGDLLGGNPLPALP